MGALKEEVYTAAHLRLAELAKAIGHPARVAILEYLSETAGCICGDISNAVPLAQPTISLHLKALRDAGIIRGTVEGRAVCYCLNPDALAEVQVFLQLLQQRAFTDSNNTCC
jgi:DNA-binding transcriptional ArsR family regulator